MNSIDSQIKSLQIKQKEILNKKEKELLLKFKKKYIGKCFKYKNNYGSDCEGWWLYLKIIDVNSITFYDKPNANFKLLTIQKTAHDIIEIQLNSSYIYIDDCIKISLKEFNKQYKKILDIAYKEIK